MVAFYFDNDVSARLAPLLRADGHAVTTTRDRQQARAHDEAQLLTALDLHAAIVTHNHKDFALLHRAWELWRHRWRINEPHPSMVVLPHAPESVLAHAIRQLLIHGPPGPSTLHRFHQGHWRAD